MACDKLRSFLDDNKPISFDIVGGCGIDTSLGKISCMGAAGFWFKYCPFCGKKIVSKFENLQWSWWEE